MFPPADLAQVTISLPMTDDLVPLSLPSKPTTTRWSFRERIDSPCLVRWNSGLSTWKVNGVVLENTLRNVMGVVEPAFTTKGPWGFGGTHVPNSGKVYSPPMGEVTISMPRCSPILEGSKVTSTEGSVPEPGAAVIVLSTWKSELSTCNDN